MIFQKIRNNVPEMKKKRVLRYNFDHLLLLVVLRTHAIFNSKIN